MAEINLRLDEIYHLCRDKAKGMCPVRFCRNHSRPDGRLCGTHHTAAWRKRNPTKAALQTLRTHAKARKLAFDIPFEAFKELCERTGYVEGKGSRPENLAIDRIRNWEGYVMGNIRVTTVAINGSKGFHEGRLKLSNGQSVLWDVISVEEYDHRENERVAAHNEWHPGRRKAEQESQPEQDDDDLPAWLRTPPAPDDADCPF